MHVPHVREGILTATPEQVSSSRRTNYWIFGFPRSHRRSVLPGQGLPRYSPSEVNVITPAVFRAFFSADTWVHEPRRLEPLVCTFTMRELDAVATPQPMTREVLKDSWIARGIALRAGPSRGLICQKGKRQSCWQAFTPPRPGSRGPATIMTSILSAETAFFWMMDRPQLMHRFTKLLADRMVTLNQILREFSGNAEPGWWITDDNCALFNRKLYREYCVPVLEQVLDAMAPGDARRYQHSDSAMGHLLDMQYGLGIRVVNYGPEVDAGLIRAKMPGAMIHGQMPPFLLRNGSPENIRLRVISDFAKAGATGGLTIATAGSLAAGTASDACDG